MDVGHLYKDANGNLTFDIADVNETQPLLVQSDSNNVIKTRWIFQGEDGKFVINERTLSLPNVATRGSLLKISEVPGYAQATLGTVYDKSVVGKLAADIDFDDTTGFTTKQVTYNGVQFTAVLAPVIL